MAIYYYEVKTLNTYYVYAETEAEARAMCDEPNQLTHYVKTEVKELHMAAK